MIAFKEWALICELLGSGAQSVILRKGGIAEGRAGFRFKHSEFLLFPTLFHEQAAKLKLPPDSQLPVQRDDGQHAITLAAHVEWTREVTDWNKIEALASFHFWTEAEIERRFRQDEQPGINVAFARISRLNPPLLFPDLPRYGGCRSWVEVPETTAGTSFTPVLDEEAHAERARLVLAAID